MRETSPRLILEQKEAVAEMQRPFAITMGWARCTPPVGRRHCMRIVKVGESYICPVCGKYTFEYAGDFDICPVCNWEDDLCQLENPDEEDCANHMSL